MITPIITMIAPARMTYLPVLPNSCGEGGAVKKAKGNNVNMTIRIK